MASKAEISLWSIGGLATLGALLFRRRISREAFTNALIFGGGTLLTAGVMTGVRVGRSRVQLSAALADSNLGLALTEVHKSAGGQTLKVYDDAKMGIKERVFLLQGLVAGSVKDADVRKLALAITGHGRRKIKVGTEAVNVVGAACPARDDMCEARAIFDWTSNPENLRYTGDVGPHALSPGGPVEAIDLFSSARRAIEMRGEDCDGHAVVNATLGAQNGFPVKFRITSNTGETWDHIYTMFGVPKIDPTRWIAIDTTLGPGRFNKQPARKKQVDFAA
jgi:hypothetical protein